MLVRSDFHGESRAVDTVHTSTGYAGKKHANSEREIVSTVRWTFKVKQFFLQFNVSRKNDESSRGQTTNVGRFD